MVMKFKPESKRPRVLVEYIDTRNGGETWIYLSDQNPSVGIEFIGPDEDDKKFVDTIKLQIGDQCFSTKDIDDLIALLEFAKSVLEDPTYG